MNAAEHLRALAAALPPGGSVLLSRAAIDHWLAEEGAGSSTSSGGQLEQLALTVDQAAERLGRAGSTIRTWLSQGDAFPHAFKLRGRQWRIPYADIVAFLEAEAQRYHQPAELEPSDSDPEDTSAWRQHLRRAS